MIIGKDYNDNKDINAFFKIGNSTNDYVKYEINNSTFAHKT